MFGLVLNSPALGIVQFVFSEVYRKKRVLILNITNARLLFFILSDNKSCVCEENDLHVMYTCNIILKNQVTFHLFKDDLFLFKYMRALRCHQKLINIKNSSNYILSRTVNIAILNGLPHLDCHMDRLP